MDIIHILERIAGELDASVRRATADKGFRGVENAVVALNVLKEIITDVIEETRHEQTRRR